MARTIINIHYTKSFQQVENLIENILRSEGYDEINRNGEMVWKRGTGFLTAMQFIKTEYTENVVTISGWVQTGMGNVGGAEMDLNGFVAALPKKKVMNVIEKIQTAVC